MLIENKPMNDLLKPLQIVRFTLTPVRHYYTTQILMLLWHTFYILFVQNLLTWNELEAWLSRQQVC